MQRTFEIRLAALANSVVRSVSTVEISTTFFRPVTQATASHQPLPCNSRNRFGSVATWWMGEADRGDAVVLGIRLGEVLVRGIRIAHITL